MFMKVNLKGIWIAFNKLVKKLPLWKSFKVFLNTEFSLYGSLWVLYYIRLRRSIFGFLSVTVTHGSCFPLLPCTVYLHEPWLHSSWSNITAIYIHTLSVLYLCGCFNGQVVFISFNLKITKARTQKIITTIHLVLKNQGISVRRVIMCVFWPFFQM